MAGKKKNSTPTMSSTFSGFPKVVLQPIELPYPIRAVSTTTINSCSTSTSPRPSHTNGASRTRQSVQGGVKRREKESRRRRKVTEGIPWKCPFPGCESKISYNREYDRNRHMKTHLPRAQKEFHCEQPNCVYVSTQKRNLDSHIRGHKGEDGKLTCFIIEDGEACQFRYTDPSQLTRHRQTVHGWPTREEKELIEAARREGIPVEAALARAKSKATFKARTSRALYQATKRLRAASRAGTDGIINAMNGLRVSPPRTPALAPMTSSSSRDFESPPSSPMSQSLSLSPIASPQMTAMSLPPPSPCNSRSYTPAPSRATSSSPIPSQSYTPTVPAQRDVSPPQQRQSYHAPSGSRNGWPIVDHFPVNTWPPPPPFYYQAVPCPLNSRPQLPPLAALTSSRIPHFGQTNYTFPPVQPPAQPFGYIPLPTGNTVSTQLRGAQYWPNYTN